jgi:hypothetical protein
VLFQTSDNTQTMTVTANASGITGTMYAPGAPLSEGNTGALQASLIFDTITISGKGLAGPSNLTSSIGAAGSGALIDISNIVDVANSNESLAVFERSTPNTSGSRIPNRIKIKVTDALGNKVKSPSMPVVSTSVVGSNVNLVPQVAPGSSDPRNLLTFDPTTGTYRFDLKMKGYKSGI